MNNIQLETAYLGNIIGGLGELDGNLKSDDFYDAKNRIIFSAILKYGTEIELIRNELIVNLKGDKKNIDDYFADILNSNPIYNLKEAAGEIKKLSIRRQVLNYIEEYKNDKIKLPELINFLNQIVDTKQPFTPKAANFLQGDDIKFNLFFPQGEVSMIAGNGGVGKTYISIYLAMQFCRNTGKKALLWLTEDAEGTLKERLGYLSRNYRIEIPANLFFEFNRSRPIMDKNYGKIVKTGEFKDTMNYIKKFDLIILDPLASFCPFDVNKNDDGRKFLDTISDEFKKTDKSLIFLHHTSKFPIAPLKSLIQNLSYEEVSNRLTKIQGASQIVNAARFVCYLETAGDSTYKKLLSVVKSNVGYTGDVIETLETPHKKEAEIWED